MGPIIENPSAEPQGGGRWKLNKPLRVYDEEIGYIVIPKGFVTDLDSVPRLPFAHMLLKGRTVTAAIVHDYAYKTGWAGDKKVSRKAADQLFLRLMQDEGVSWFSRSLIYFGVRAGGFLSWRKRRA